MPPKRRAKTISGHVIGFASRYVAATIGAAHGLVKAAQGGSFWDTLDQTASPIVDACTKFGDEQNAFIIQEVFREGIARAMKRPETDRRKEK
jgi:hypothetical protein